MSFMQFWAILRARRWVAIGTFVGVVVLAVVANLVLPKTFKAEATIVIDTKPDPVALMNMPTMSSATFVATQVDIMASDRVALRVIRELKLTENEAIREQWQKGGDTVGTIEQFLVDVLQKGLEVKPSRESNVVSLSYASPNPQFSAAVANAFAQSYIQTTLELRADPAQNLKRFFDTQVKGAREALEKAQERFSGFQREKGIIATDERLDVENARLTELSSQLTQLQAISAESTSRQTEAQGSRGDRIQEVLNNPLIASLKAELSRNEARLQELSQRLGDSHPQVVEAKASIAELRSKLDSETRRITGGVQISNTINKAREGQVRASLEAQRAKVLQMKEVRDEGVVLQREVENSQRIYDSLVARLSQTGLEAQNTQSYAAVLTSAVPPTIASSPRVLRNMLLAVVVGIWLAAVLVFVMELADRRVRRPVDVVTALGLPMLGVLPAANAKRPSKYRGGVLLPPALTAPADTTGR
ncbi:chain length determinant protein EpsF [Roseateles sp. BYS87W]|uniref:Chain length determinant protein EpsF n=1 Tax=Pelomonas baiyunensis TaxID=3299026 RepID=A0ABW7H3H4_9BURK